jgi:hypothetical protein
MHARIKELVVRSGFDTWSDTVIVDGVDITRTVGNLAELIVRECAKIANENVGAFTPGCGNTVLEHFGVEE